jgi:hypothetical protein
MTRIADVVIQFQKPETILRRSLWVHYKGGCYQVESTNNRHCETKDLCVRYQSLDDAETEFWLRPVWEWCSTVRTLHSDVLIQQPRFILVPTDLHAPELLVLRGHIKAGEVPIQSSAPFMWQLYYAHVRGLMSGEPA